MSTRPSPARALVALGLAVAPLSVLLRQQFADPNLARQVTICFASFAVAVVAVQWLGDRWAALAGSAIVLVVPAVAVDRYSSASGTHIPVLLILIGLLVLGATIRLGDRRRDVARGICLAGLLVSWVGLFAAVAGWLAVRNFTVLGFGLTAAAVGALGVVRVPGVRSPEARTSLLLAPLLATEVLVATRTGVRLPTLMVAGLLGLLTVAAVRPATWAPVERLGRPVTGAVDLALDALDRPLRWLGCQLPMLGHLLRSLGRLLRRVDARLRKGFEVVASVLRRVLLTVVWIPSVLLPWLLQRLLGRDPLWAPRRQGSRWVPRIEDDPRSHAQWVGESAHPTVRRAQVRRRRLRTAVRPVGLALLLVGIVLVRVSDGQAPTFPGQVDEPWYATYQRAQNQAFRDETLSQFVGIEMPEISSPYLNIRDGRRASWEPPATTCDERLVIWLFGGSTAWGLNQRDDRTIPSELARAAWEDDVALEVVNWAVPGDVAFQEQRRLERALDAGDSEPDLVVFYDGFNDLRAQATANRAGRGGEGTFMALIDGELLPVLEKAQVVRSQGETSFQIEVIDMADLPRADHATVVPAALFQYNAAHRSTAALLARHDIPGTRFFQPVLGSRAHEVDGDYKRGPDDVVPFARMRAGVAPGVVDLAGVLDDRPEPFFTDDIHTTEAANPIIAAAMYRHLDPALAALTPHEGSSPACS
ncbi:MAG: hypothetical protein JWM47_2258 [Acidimicrobiales bacterium]|nr:hypothetical protein [Acidimicrobiales bacterium]